MYLELNLKKSKFMFPAARPSSPHLKCNDAETQAQF